MQSRYKLIISYDGTNYCGWQVQPSGLSIQDILQKAFFVFFKEKVHITASGRTDAGVHAYGQVAHVDLLTKNVDNLEKLLYSLNSILPSDIRIKSIELASNDFHARYSAIKKTYHYFIHLDPILDPFSAKYRYHVKHRLDLDLLKQAAKLFVGKKDFRSFANKQTLGCAKNKPIKTLYRLDVKEEENGLRLEFEGDGFLYKMVRNIVGTLLDVGSKKISLSELEAIIKAKDRKKAGISAPAHALFLVKVDYPKASSKNI